MSCALLAAYPRFGKKIKLFFGVYWTSRLLFQIFIPAETAHFVQQLVVAVVC